MDSHLRNSGHCHAMRRRGTVWLTALVLLGVVFRPAMGGTAVVRPHPSVAPAPLVFDGVTVIDVREGRRLPAQRVVIVGNRITAMGDVHAVPLPAGARVVNARGKYLIPGLWDLHTHFAGGTGNRSVDQIYPVAIANGNTGFRSAGSNTSLDTLRMWRREILAGTRVGPPREILSGQALGGSVEGLGAPEAGCVRNPQSWFACLTDAADARHVVDSLKAAGADMIKPREVDRALYFVIAAEARRLGIPFGGHAKEVTVLEASDSGASIVDHVGYFSGDAFHKRNERCWGATATAESCQLVAERFKRNGTWLVPTVMNVLFLSKKNAAEQRIFASDQKRLNAFLASQPVHGNWLHDSASASTANASHADSLGAMAMMHRVGLPIMAGTDMVLNGFALHSELALYVVEGLTPLEALQSATLNPAKFLHATDSLGSVAPGKLADLVLLDADPLADITNTTTIQAVVANGRYFDRAALDQLLIDARAVAVKLNAAKTGH